VVAGLSMAFNGHRCWCKIVIMGQQFVLLSVWMRIAIFAAVWFLVFLPSRSTIAVVSGAVISYSAARRGSALGRRTVQLSRHALNHRLRADRPETIRSAQQSPEPFGSGYDLYSPSENRWIIGGDHYPCPTGDALFDYLHFSLSKGGGAQERRDQNATVAEVRPELTAEQGAGRGPRVGRSQRE
jgi:hypothetical protein